jgi:hypothetical protein
VAQKKCIGVQGQKYGESGAIAHAICSAGLTIIPGGGVTQSWDLVQDAEGRSAGNVQGWSYAEASFILPGGKAGLCGYCPGCCNDDGTRPDSYDSVSGECVKADTHGTPGKYASLAECEAANKGKCDGECVSTDDLAALQQAADRVKSKFCK